MINQIGDVGLHRHGVLLDDAGCDVNQRRRDGVAAAREQAGRMSRGLDPDPWDPGLGTCEFGPGRIALALAGDFDRVGLERLAVLCRELPRLASAELVIDCRALSSCGPALARALARLRIQCLTAGAIVELHHPPELLAADLGPRPPTRFAVRVDPR